MEAGFPSRLFLSSGGGKTSIFPWMVAGIPVGFLFLLASSLEVRWFLVLLVGAGFALVSLFFQDKKLFYLMVYAASISMGLVLHLGLKPSSVYRSTHAFLVSLCHIPLLATTGFHLLRSYRDGTPAFTTRAALAAAAFLFVACTLSVAFSDFAPYGVLDLFALATSLLVFLGTANVIMDRRELNTVLTVLVLSVSIQGILAAAQHLFNSTLGLELLGAPRILESYAGLSRVSRSGGTLGHPNSLALYMDLYLPLCFSLFLCPALRKQRLLLGFGVLLGLAGLASTLSRGGVLASTVALISILMLHWRRRIGLVRSAFGLLVVVVLAGVVILSTPNPIQKRFSTYDYGTGYGRYSLAGVAVNVIKENPVFGVGLNAFTEAARLLDDTPERIVTLWNAPVHNLLLFVAGETGLLGLFSFLVFLGIVLFSLRGPLSSQDPLIAHSSLGILMGFTAFLIHCLVDYIHWTHFNPFWFLAGFALSLCRIARSSPPG